MFLFPTVADQGYRICTLGYVPLFQEMYFYSGSLELSSFFWWAFAYLIPIAFESPFTYFVVWHLTVFSFFQKKTTKQKHFSVSESLLLHCFWMTPRERRQKCQLYAIILKQDISILNSDISYPCFLFPLPSSLYILLCNLSVLTISSE